MKKPFEIADELATARALAECANMAAHHELIPQNAQKALTEVLERVVS